MNWVEILNNAIEYIENNLLDNIALSQIAEHVHISSAHLQRGFSALADLTVGEYIRNRRLSLAGLELTHKNLKIVDIAIKYGYETPESFSKAFSRFHGIAPSAARKNSTALKSYSRLTIKIIMEGGSVMDYRIEERESFDVVVKVRKIEAEEGDSRKIPAFWEEYFAEGFSAKIVPVLGVCSGMSQESKEFLYGIGDFVKDGQEIPEGFEIWQIPKSTWAVFKCVGAMPKAIQEMWKRIYSEWLPQAKYEIMPAYDFEFYTDGDTGSQDYISEIWLPVKKK
ncbi:MAG: AraC family transcriptional regulator [Defluviitaleaceae bacterium]|nr:AraC family transcriptional regulator [Defluviitaleaceae bacterium]